MRVASIDVGTNTLRLYVGEFSSGALRRVAVCREITRLGGGFDRGSGLISDEAVGRTIATIRKFPRFIESYGVKRLRAVATSVVREAKNGRDFLNLIREQTGITVEVISGDEEARLTARGVLDSLRMDRGALFLFDVGGGSTEYVYIEDSAIEWVRSLPLGVVHLAEEYLPGGAVVGERELSLLKRHVAGALREGLGALMGEMREDFVLAATAGTPTTLAAIDLELDPYNPDLVNGHRLARRRVEEILRTLMGLEASQRLALKGLEKGREDVIVPGAVIVLETMEGFSRNEVLVSEGGLLEGIALSIL